MASFGQAVKSGTHRVAAIKTAKMPALPRLTDKVQQAALMPMGTSVASSPGHVQVSGGHSHDGKHEYVWGVKWPGTVNTKPDLIEMEEVKNAFKMWKMFSFEGAGETFQTLRATAGAIVSSKMPGGKH
mmetsp:Transcript_27426/g.59967  ORF Transcript_27426/g.59967 Transcript_27426/m.59967 type:complete len:128 (+) Transcript_27426:107-490(+)|eukprot:CAMPEP_0170603006 /NCGR_PEP_ID=MMETSP0224-20130122/18690_1 /TAXON_ID=285029 /ORGANISM="Togula jolla, Strain CCCM 725" /LENGTH=127 /DNA_ID=CAMNT_0010927875 /DNA_START=90 /DNA_END=473 /DNA_ORIENTATION=+